METTEKIIRKYLNFSGERTTVDFLHFLAEVNKAIEKASAADLKKLNYIKKKLLNGLTYSLDYDEVFVIVDESMDDFDEMDKLGKVTRKPKSPTVKAKTKPKTTPKPVKKKKKPKKDLGKLVDEGENTEGRADQYWRNNGMEVIFKHNNKAVREGQNVPSNYDYTNMKYLINYYGLNGLEFGNWTSQQDRMNYLAGLGLALFDLKDVINLEPKEIGLKGKLTVAFGARGRGKAKAHFEPGTFVINLTRYKRPPHVANRKRTFNRTDLIAQSGGIGSFAHEYGHALDYYGGMYIDKTMSKSLSDGDSTRTTPDRKLITKASLHGYMEKLLFKIIWDANGKDFSTYYKRLIQKVGKGKAGVYWKQRNEIFARAFEVYVHYKMQKKKTKNIFLAKTKYEPNVYLSIAEMKKLEKDFDVLMNALKRKI